MELSSCKTARSDLVNYKNQFRDIEEQLQRMQKLSNQWEELSGSFDIIFIDL